MEHCGNYNCEIRHKCERYTGELHYTQSVRCFSYSKKKKSCNNFIENEKSKSNNELIEKIQKEFGLSSGDIYCI